MKNIISSYDYAQAERQLISGDAETKQQIVDELLTKKSKIDYFMSRFLEDHGSRLEESPQSKFYADKSEEYAKINRLLRIANAYI